MGCLARDGGKVRKDRRTILPSLYFCPGSPFIIVWKILHSLLLNDSMVVIKFNCVCNDNSCETSSQFQFMFLRWVKIFKSGLLFPSSPYILSKTRQARSSPRSRSGKWKMTSVYKQSLESLPFLDHSSQALHRHVLHCVSLDDLKLYKPLVR